MDPLETRIAELCGRFDLPRGSAERLRLLLRLVADEPQALTTVREPAQAVELHIADSLSALDLPVVREASRIADLGSGGGFPGLVLAIALPDADVALVESVGKKAAFLAGAAARLGLPRVEAVPLRAEDWPAGRGWADVVTARALAPLGVLVEYAAPILRDGGTLVAWKARPDEGEIRDAAVAATTLAMSPPVAVPVPHGLVRGAVERSLYVSSRVGDLPAGYPRRPGMARKRPLRAST